MEKGGSEKLIPEGRKDAIQSWDKNRDKEEFFTGKKKKKDGREEKKVNASMTCHSTKEHGKRE